jgi:hypothetical protein
MGREHPLFCAESVTYVFGIIRHPCDRNRPCGRWLAALDDFRNWLIREAA